MSDAMLQRMEEATRLTRAGKLTEATELLRHWRSNRAPAADPAPLRVTAGVGAAAAAAPSGLNLLRTAFSSLSGGFENPFDPLPRAEARADAPPAAGRFLAAQFSNHAGSRPYKLYVPAAHRGAPLPLVVMLHGCTQSPDDFAAGTRMNGFAEELGFLVCYPGQTRAANNQKCWNWFNAADQHRGSGEPALIAGITRQVMTEYAVDAARVYVAGLSAGGATAAVMGETYPDLYAAIGVHSGLACGAASDLMSAFSVMRQGGPGTPAAPLEAVARRCLPAIVFHGDRDSTVHPSNGDEVIAQVLAEAPLDRRIEAGRVAGGHRYTVTRHLDAAGVVWVEAWSVHGAGHAWSGGSPAGSFTDPLGPDASREMLRFFLDHPRAERQ